MTLTLSRALYGGFTNEAGRAPDCPPAGSTGPLFAGFMTEEQPAISKAVMTAKNRHLFGITQQGYHHRREGRKLLPKVWRVC